MSEAGDAQEKQEPHTKDVGKYRLGERARLLRPATAKPYRREPSTAKHRLGESAEEVSECELEM